MVHLTKPHNPRSTHVRVAEHDTEEYDEVPHEDYVIVGRNDPGFLAPTTQNNLMILTVGRDIRFSGEFELFMFFFFFFKKKR